MRPASVLVNLDPRGYFAVDGALHRQQVPLDARQRMVFSRVCANPAEALGGCSLLADQTHVLAATGRRVYELGVPRYRELVASYFDALCSVAAEYGFQRLEATRRLVQQQKYRLVDEEKPVRDFDENKAFVEGAFGPEEPVSTVLSYKVAYAAANGQEVAYSITFAFICFNDEAFKLQFISTLNTACKVKPKSPFLRLLTGLWRGPVSLLYFNHARDCFPDAETQHRSLQAFYVMQRDLVAPRAAALGPLDELNLELDVYSEQLAVLQAEYLATLEERRPALREAVQARVRAIHEAWLRRKEAPAEERPEAVPEPAPEPEERKEPAAPTRENLKYGRMLDASLRALADSHQQISARMKLQGQLEHTLAKLEQLKQSALDARIAQNSLTISQNQMEMRRNAILRRSIAITQRHAQLRDSRVARSLSQAEAERESLFRSSCLNADNQRSVSERSQLLSSQLRSGTMVGSSLRRSGGFEPRYESDTADFRLLSLDVYLDDEPRLRVYATPQTRRLFESLQGYDIFYPDNYKAVFPEQIEYLCVKLGFCAFYTNYDLSCFRRRDGSVLVLKDCDVLEVLEMMALEVKQHEDALERKRQERAARRGGGA